MSHFMDYSINRLLALGEVRDFLKEFGSRLERQRGRYGITPSLFIVGGWIRDNAIEYLHGCRSASKDLDLVVTGFSEREMEEVEALLGRCTVRSITPVMGIFPVIKVHLPSGFSLDVALARGYERSTGKGHKDFTFKTEGISIVEDLARRDFTMNALALEILPADQGLELDLIDPFDGLGAIKARRIETVGDPEQKFLGNFSISPGNTVFPLTQTLSPGGEGRVRGCFFWKRFALDENTAANMHQI